jgi:hypothetical protein
MLHPSQITPETRLAIIADCITGETQKSVSTRYDCSPAFVSRLMLATVGTSSTPRKPSYDEVKLKALLNEAPTSSVKDLSAKFGFGLRQTYRILHDNKVSWMKRSYMVPLRKCAKTKESLQSQEIRRIVREELQRALLVTHVPNA